MPVALLVTAWISVAALTVCSAAAADRPNIILIVTDDLGWWDLGVYGNKTIETPVLDRLASEGARLTHFYASPVCTPTRASLMTGRHYQRTGAVDTYRGRDVMDPSEVTLGQVLARQGYRTGLVGKWHLGRYMKYHPNQRGFGEFFGFWQYGLINDYFDTDELFDNRLPVKTVGYVTEVLTNRALDFIERHRRAPFFLYLAYNAPHAPYLVPDSYIEKYLKKGLPISEARIYGMITALDENIGRVLDRVERLDLKDDTIVIFMSDNGGVSRHFRAGLRAGKGSVYEGGIRVPLIARWPGRIRAGAVVDAPAQHVDVLPTICEIVGAPLPAGRPIDGKSIFPLLRDGRGDSPHEYLFHQWNRVRPAMSQPAAEEAQRAFGDARRFSPNWAVQQVGGYKLVATAEDNTSDIRYQLFDLRQDPAEAIDLSARRPEIVSALKAKFGEWFADVTAGRDYGRVPIQIGRSDENPVEIDLTWSEPVGRRVRPEYRNYNRDVIDNWSEVGDFVRWKIEVVRAGRYQVGLSYGCRPGDEGSRLMIRAGEAKLEHVVAATAGREVYRAVEIGALQLAAGPATLEIKPRSIRSRELFVLHKVWLSRRP